MLLGGEHVTVLILIKILVLLLIPFPPQSHLVCRCGPAARLVAAADG